MINDSCKSLENFLDNGFTYRRNVSLRKHSYFRTGGLVHFFLTPDSIDELKRVVTYLSKEKLRYRVFGGMSNCIFLDDTDLNIVISLKNLKHISLNKKDDEVIAEAGVKLPAFVVQLKSHSITGFEGLEGIPAFLGGAIYMNAGSYGYEISDYLVSVTVMDCNGELIELTKDACQFSYRHSIFHNQHRDKIIVSMCFKVIKGNYEEIEKKIHYYYNHRRTTLEYKNPNVGSIFVTHDIYKELAKQSFIYRMILVFMRVFFHRAFRIKSNWLLNQITFRFFGLSDYLDVVSVKTMNVAVNRDKGTQKVKMYIEALHKIIGQSVRREIEII